jgi:very-short-patch-repair endonuclease
MTGTQFRHQYAIGNYIVDFCSPRRKLMIELHGHQHPDQAARKSAEYDEDYG